MPWDVPPQPTAQQEADFLRAQAAQMEEALKRIQERLGALDQEK